MDDRLTNGISTDVPLTDEQTAQLLRRANLLSQLSNILCGKELATLEELLQGASQVKAELAAAKLERVALERDFKSFANCTHSVCHYCASNSDFNCGKCWYRYPEAFVWRGVCPENTEVQE